MKVSLHNIDILQSEKSIKTLAFALLIKDTYVSSAVKNYNPHALQKKLAEKGFKFHHSTINKYINTLIGYGLADVKNKCLIVKKLHTQGTAKIHVEKGLAKEFKDYVHIIRGEILRRKMWQAKYVYEKRSLSVKLMERPNNPEEYRTGKKLAEKFGKMRTDETSFEYKQSILSFSKMFNCSVEEIYSTLKFLVNIGWLTVKRNIKCVSAYFGGEILLPNYFVCNNNLFNVECNGYTLNQICQSMNIDSKKCKRKNGI